MLLLLVDEEEEEEEEEGGKAEKVEVKPLGMPRGLSSYLLLLGILSHTSSSPFIIIINITIKFPFLILQFLFYLFSITGCKINI